MIAAFTRVMDTLLVYPDAMMRNLELTRGLIFSQSVLLALTMKGMARETAYALVQKHAMDVWQSSKQFRELIAADPKIKKYLTINDLDDLFDLKKSLKHVDEIFTRCGIV